jgi:probable selenium-dependent hydroxylase accessory protein YqeC
VSGTEAGPLLERLRHEFAARRHVTAVAPDAEGGSKAAGLPVAVLDVLASSRIASHVLVEADGSAGRSLKAHRDHEPVVSAKADLVIAVVGVDCLGAPMDDAHVHRAALLRERLGRPADATVTAADVSAVVLGADGWLARVAPGTEVIVFVNQADTPERLAAAQELAAAMRARDREGRLARIVVGDVRTGVFAVVG